VDLQETVAQIALTRDNPMYIVTTAEGDERSGCLVGFATQCSVDPPRWAVCLSKKNRTYEVAGEAAVLAVHFLGRDERELAELFGGETGHEVDKFERCAWHEGPGGAPILEATEAWIVGPTVHRFDAGDHGGFVIDIEAAELRSREPQLGFQAAKDIEPGHDP
jgi:flavin reductase (DIM6/NTAB) family NADH-FMN oxidoreductase RutF